METIALLLISLLILGFGLVSQRIRSSPLTAPMVFVIFGFAVGPSGSEWVEVDLSTHATKFIMELTLILVLFTDAGHIYFRHFWREQKIALRLLCLGLILQVVLGTFLGYGLFEDLDIWAAALLAAVLVPTDAALGQACLDNPEVPKKLRQTIEVESGLNDGLALPLITFLVVCQNWTGSDRYIGFWIGYLSQQLLVAAAVGSFVGFVGARLVVLAASHGWMNTPYKKLSMIALALASFSLSQLLGGNGFVATYIAGLVVGHSQPSLRRVLHDFAEVEGSLLVLIAFFLFGAVLLPLCYYVLSWELFFYTLLTLVGVRMLATALSTLGLGLHRDTVFFLGWMGPRGIASILFGLLVLEAAEVEQREAIFRIATAVVTASVLLHGVTAHALSSCYVKRLKRRTHELILEP